MKKSDQTGAAEPTFSQVVEQSTAGMVAEGQVIADMAGLDPNGEPKPVQMVFVHPGPGPQEIPNLGVFTPGDEYVFPGQEAADKVFATGWFAPHGGKSKRQLEAEKSPAPEGGAI